MRSLPQGEMLIAVDAAITCLEKITGRMPTPEQVQAVLAIAGIQEEILAIKRLGDMVYAIRLRSAQQEKGAKE